MEFFFAHESMSSAAHAGVSAVILSVCIPTYSRWQDLLSSMGPASDQLFKGTEFGVSDNRSVDGTADAVRA